MATRVIGIKAENETIENFERILDSSKKEWFEKNVNKSVEKEKIAFEKSEKFIIIPCSEYESLISGASATKHAQIIFERIMKKNALEGKPQTFENLFAQIEAFCEMNGLFLDKRKDGENWIIDCKHGIGRSFSRFGFHLIKKICISSTKYEIVDKKILDNFMILFIKKIPPGTRRKRLTSK